MKQIFTILAVAACFNLFGQHEIGKKVNLLVSANTVFKPVSILSAAHESNDAKIEATVTKSTTATLEVSALATLAASNVPFIELEIPYQDQIISLQLYKADILAEGFHVDTDQAKYVDYNQGAYYRGIIKGDYTSVAAFSFFNNEMSGIVSGGILGNLVVGKLDKAGNNSQYIIYADADLKINSNFECHTQDPTSLPVASDHQNNRTTLTSKCVTMYFEMDHDLYLASGSNTTTAVNWITAVFNNVKTLYANDGINVALKSVYVWTNLDPYFGATSAEYLNEFGAGRPVFDGDVGQLIGLDSGGLGGVAVTINGLCSTNNFSYADIDYSYSTVPTYSWTVMVITHEFGHLLGSPHTHACIWNGNNTPIDSCGPYSIGPTGEGYSCMTTPPLLPSALAKGTIMSYCHLLNIGIKFSNGFGPQPLARVLTAVNGGTCLSTDCINTCINTVLAINTVSEATTATVSWNQLSDTNNSQVSIVPVGSAPVYITTNGHAYTANNLSPNTYYKVTVRPSCDAAITTELKETIFLTSADYCNGIVLTDSGGLTGTHSNNEDYIRTMIPNEADKKIKLTFSSFFLIGHDRLFIYDGNSTTAPDLTNGGLVGNAIPGPYESTAADGSLTLHFVSDDVVVRPGWVANVSCTSMLGTNSYQPNIDFTYSPNPTNGWISISSRSQIGEITVYNSVGQLLYHKQVNALDAKVDMTAFATGTYFYKIKFGGKEANFKILKQ